MCPASPRMSSDDPRRRAPRRSVETASCEAGDLLDLSPFGMRLSMPAKSAPQTGAVMVFRIRAPEGAIAVSGRVVWGKRCGLLKRQIGVEFVQMSPALKTALHALAEFGCLSAAASTGGSAFASSSTSGRSKSAGRAAPKIDVDMPDLYQILGILPNASEDDIQAAYRALAKKLHPDLNPDPEAGERFIMVNKAHEILSNPDMRAAYDLRRAA